MKKIISLLLPVLFFGALFSPLLAHAAADEGTSQIVPKACAECTGSACENACSWDELQGSIQGILDIIVNEIAVPLGTLAIIIGAIIMLISAGNPRLAGLGRTILIAAIVGLVLALGTKAIINGVLSALGASGYSVK